MRHLKTLGVTLVAMFALGVTALGMTATSAVALPDVSILSGETFPLDWHFKDNKVTPCGVITPGGGLLEGKGWEYLVLLATLSALGEYHWLCLEVVETGTTNECHSEGDAAGEILITGEWHLVPITETPTLTNGIAYLLPHLLIVICPHATIDFRGCLLASSNATENSVDLSETSVTLGTNGKGKNLLTEYINDSKAKVKCTLTEEIVGTKKAVEASWEVDEGKSVTLTIPSGSLAKMFEFTGL